MTAFLAYGGMKKTSYLTRLDGPKLLSTVTVTVQNTLKKLRALFLNDKKVLSGETLTNSCRLPIIYFHFTLTLMLFLF